MADFKKAFALTMGHEGGYANSKYDTGGETYKGISRVHNPNWSGWPIIDEVKKTTPVARLDKVLAPNQDLQARVLAIYKAQYWDVNKLDQVDDQAIANELFDTGVNMGVSTAAKFLQRALNVTNLNQRLYADVQVDGRVGPATLGALNKHPKPASVYKWLNIMQGERYLDLMERAPAQEVFANTWLSRVDFVKTA